VGILVLLLSICADAQCVISCKPALNFSLDPSGQLQISPSILLQDPTCDPLDFTVDITDSQGNSYGNQLSCTELGLNLTARVTEVASGNFCLSAIQLFDYLPPVILADTLFIGCTKDAHPDSVGYPDIQDNCTGGGDLQISWTDVALDLGCFTTVEGIFVTSKIERTWEAVDESGNQRQAIQHLYFRRRTIGDIQFPVNRDGFAAPVLACEDNPFDLNLTGQPLIDGLPIMNGGHVN